MGAIPTSDMPGHKRLHERAILALDRCMEARDIDFKESCQWDTLQWRIIKTSMGMANLRDGGIIIIGASERESTWDLTGISVDHLKTYDVDKIVELANAYASPHVNLDIVTVAFKAGGVFLAIQIAEFSDTPVVCKKNGPDRFRGTPDELSQGAVYLRPHGMARTTKVTDATQMHDLLELAAEKRARRILETSRKVGFMPPSGPDAFDLELGGL